MPPAGDIATARRLNGRLIPIYNVMFCELQSGRAEMGRIPLLGKCTPHVRLPLIELTEAGWPKYAPRWKRRTI